MTTARLQKEDSESKIPAQQTAKRTSTTMAFKRFCCTDNILLLPVSGSFVGLLGLVLLVLYLVSRGLTSSLYLVEGAVPSYAVAAMLMLTGLCVILLVRFRYFILNSFAVFLCLGTLTLCLVSVITTAIVSIPFLESFSTCILRSSSAQCQCYVLADRENSTNTGIVVPGVDSKTYTFFGARTCSNVENTLKDFLYAMCVIYGFASIACLFSGVLSLLSLCTHRRYVKKQTVDRTVSSSNRGRRTSQNSETRQPLNTNQPSPSVRPPVANVESGADEQGRTSQNQRSSSSNRPASRVPGQGSRSRPVQRSSSLSQNSSSTPRQVSRHHSATTADVQGSRSGQRRPPPLIRGGFLQSHVNGPSIPVYTVPGSNEAYVALTDLPSLQMPSMGDVPAYVSDIPDQFPVEEPPPYTPSADARPPPVFTPFPEMPDIPEGTSPPPDIIDSTVTSQPTPQADVTAVTVESVQQVLSSSGNRNSLQPTLAMNITEPERDDTNNLNEGANSARNSPAPVVQTISGNSQGLSAFSAPPLATGAQVNNDQLLEQARYDTHTVPDAGASSESRSRSVSRSRENSPTRYTTRQEPSLSISQNVARTQSHNRQAFVDPLVMGARPKNGRYANQGSSGGHRSQTRNQQRFEQQQQQHVNTEHLNSKKKRSKSPKKSDRDKGKPNSRAATSKKLQLSNVPVSNNPLPETEIRSAKRSSKKTEHHSRSENRNAERRHPQSASNKKHKSSSPDKKRKQDSRSRSPSKVEQKQKSNKRTSSPPKGSEPLRLNYPVDIGDTSDDESIDGILDLVESVHTSRRQRSIDPKRVKKKDKKNLLDSKV